MLSLAPLQILLRVFVMSIRIRVWTIRKNNSLSRSESWSSCSPPSFLPEKQANGPSYSYLTQHGSADHLIINDLASYVIYTGPTSIATGNPLLKPTITNNLKLGY